MNVISVIKFIIAHPLNQNSKLKAILRFIKWQINTRLNPYPVIYPFTDKAKLIIQRGMTGATGNLYCGLHEFEEMGFLLHFLRAGDFFVDIGANIGSYTVLAAGHIGAKTFSIEPAPSTFPHLINNLSINKIEKKVTAFNIALGSKQGCINFTDEFDTINHVADGLEKNAIKVRLETLDDILKTQEVPLLLKIDVEGFETEVLHGASNTLKQNRLKAIIIELNGLGRRYGWDENEVHRLLLSLGFNTFQYNPIKRTLSKTETFGQHNTIYIRDLNFVLQRLETAETIKIQNHEI